MNPRGPLPSSDAGPPRRPRAITAQAALAAQGRSSRGATAVLVAAALASAAPVRGAPPGAQQAPSVRTATATATAIEAPPEAGAILIDRPARAGAHGHLHALPVSGAYEALFDETLLPVNDALEDSGGFDTPDPQRLAIYGASPSWTHWYLDEQNIDDTFFPGAAAVRVPYRLLTAAELRFAEDPANDAWQGFVLRIRPGGADDDVEPRLPGAASPTAATQASGAPPRIAGFSVTEPEAGGIFPPGIPITRYFSTTHPTDRRVPPPDERRRFGAHQRLWLLARDETALGRVRWGVEVDQGTRRFLTFAAPGGAVLGTFPERFAIATAAADLTASSGAYRAHILGEYRYRDHLFAELLRPPAETARYQSAAVTGGFVAQGLSAGATIKLFAITHRELEFTREILDPQGNAEGAAYPDGQYMTTNLDLRYRRAPLYLGANEQLLLFRPTTSSWSNPLTFDRAPYGRIDWSSAATAEAFGQVRVGVEDVVQLDPLRLRFDLYAFLAHALNGALASSLLLPDAGAKLELELPLGAGGRAFLLLARTPIPPDGALTRALDPAYLSGRRFLLTAPGTTGQLADTIGGRAISVSPHLTEASVETGALGLDLALGRRWRLALQGMARAFRDTYWIDYAGGPPANGSFSGGLFYPSLGPHRYVLDNYPGGLTRPFYVGIDAELLRLEADRWFADLTFTAQTAVGYTAFGNGPTANDLAAISESTANPNSLVRGLANLDLDRAFFAKGLLGWRILDALLLTVVVRFRDGRPFAFYTYAERGGQVAVTYQENRGSPLSRRLIGDRTDFRINGDVRLAYTFAGPGFELDTWVVVANAFDFGNEIAELSTPLGQRTRSALELEIPRALVLGVEARL